MANSLSLIKRFYGAPNLGMLIDVSKLKNPENLYSFNKFRNYMSDDLKAELGAASYKIGELAKNQFEVAQNQVNTIFGSMSTKNRIFGRSKAPVSIQTKLERGIKEGKIDSYETALAYIADANGNRVITKSLKKLNRTEIKHMIDEVRIDGKQLTNKQKILLDKYIYEKNLLEAEKAEAFPLFEKFARPLIEKRSAETVDNLCLSVAKDRMIKEGLSIQNIREKGLLSEDLIHRLETEDIVPLDLRLLDNYRGFQGLPEFSSAQIQKILKIKPDEAVVHSRADLLDINRHPNYGYTKSELKEFALKDAGYHTAQAKVLYQNGGYGEIQFRGILTNSFAEFEHLAYDLRQEKNTLGPIFDNYKKAVMALSDFEYSDYKKYLSKCYNYYNRLELGLPAKKPTLPRKFNKILSEDSMRKLYLRNQNEQNILKKNFVPYFEEVA